MLDDILGISSDVHFLAEATAAIRAALRTAGYLLDPAKNPDAPSAEVMWCGKHWGRASVPGVVRILPSPDTLHTLSDWLLNAPSRVPLLGIQQFLGAACWAAAPAHFALAFFAPIFAAAAAFPSDCPEALVTLPHSHRDLARRGLHVAALGWAGNAPTPLHDDRLCAVLARLHRRIGLGHFALPDLRLIFVDYSLIHNVCALVEVCPCGSVWCHQWCPTGDPNQQLGEYVALCGGVAHATTFTCPSCPGPSPPCVLFGDNEGALASMFFRPSPSVPGKSYWTRRLAAHLAAADPGSAPQLAHIAGDKENPADPYSRVWLITYSTITRIATVPIV